MTSEYTKQYVTRLATIFKLGQKTFVKHGHPETLPTWIASLAMAQSIVDVTAAQEAAFNDVVALRDEFQPSTEMESTLFVNAGAIVASVLKIGTFAIENGTIERLADAIHGGFMDSIESGKVGGGILNPEEVDYLHRYVDGFLQKVVLRTTEAPGETVETEAQA